MQILRKKILSEEKTASYLIWKISFISLAKTSLTSPNPNVNWQLVIVRPVIQLEPEFFHHLSFF